MHQIQLANDIYDLAKRRTDEAGFASVDEYIVDLLDDDNEYEDTPNLDHLFTPERLAIIDQSLADVKAGAPTYTVEEVWEHLAEYRAEWIRKT